MQADSLFSLPARPPFTRENAIAGSGRPSGSVYDFAVQGYSASPHIPDYLGDIDTRWHEPKRSPWMPEGYAYPIDRAIATGQNIGGFVADRAEVAAEGLAGLMDKGNLTTIPGEKGMVATQVSDSEPTGGNALFGAFDSAKENIAGIDWEGIGMSLANTNRRFSEEILPAGAIDSITGGIGSLFNWAKDTSISDLAAEEPSVEVPTPSPATPTQTPSATSPPVDPEKAAQHANASGAVVDNSGSTGEGGVTTNTDLVGITGITGAQEDNYPYPGGQSPFDLLNSATLERADLVEEARGSGLDVSDLEKAAKQDAYNVMLMRLGAGVAGGDLAKGLSDAATATSAGMQEARSLELMGAESGRSAEAEARDLELQGRKVEYQKQKELSELSRVERNAALNRALTKYGLDIRKMSQLQWVKKNATDAAQHQLEIMELAISTIEGELSNIMVKMTDAERQAKEQKKAYLIGQLIQMADEIANQRSRSEGEDSDSHGDKSATPWNELGN
jgi:hypothetical protein